MPISFSRRVIAVLFAVVMTLSATAQDGIRLRKVVIDPGHGGHDSGCISPDGKVKEKNVVLDVSLRLGERIKKEYPDVKVYYTRDKDVFIPLDKRGEFANKLHADLFISIHCNSVESKKPHGSETWVMGMDRNAANMAVCKRENSVILLEDDYTTKYRGFDPNDTESYIFFNLMQNAYFEQSLLFADLCQKEMSKGPITLNRGIKQGNLVVLWQSTMPSVLVELGFLSHSGDRAILTDKQQREAIAGDLFAAFKAFKKQYEASGAVVAPKPEPEAEQKPEPAQDTVEPQAPQAEQVPAGDEATSVEQVTGDAVFAVQIFAVSVDLKPGDARFKGEKDIHKSYNGKVYKYAIGSFKTQPEAAAAAERLKAKFPGCFVVKLDNFEIKKK
jgi:N-acetylmuramoyl-L-alanine amidase